MNKIISLLFLTSLGFGLCQIAKAQSNQQMEELVNKHVSINSSKKTMQGFRIQVYSGQERTKATELKNSLLNQYPDFASYLLYQQPYFKVRIGDFKTRLDALKLLDQVKTNFSVAFIVRDEVKLPFIDL